MSCILCGHPAKTPYLLNAPAIGPYPAFPVCPQCVFSRRGAPSSQMARDPELFYFTKAGMRTIWEAHLGPGERVMLAMVG